MNLDLSKYSIKPRGGWPAINFFFNTMLDEINNLGMDEPWSRPGDFVLLKALSDLVCISTACPCDVDPANGWNPTDIQIRTILEGINDGRTLLSKFNRQGVEGFTPKELRRIILEDERNRLADEDYKKRQGIASDALKDLANK